MKLEEIELIYSPNYDICRNGHKIKGIVIHWMAGKFNTSIKWMCNPLSKASAHYCIDKNGHSICMVLPEYRAWHAGISEMKDYGKNCNNYTIGIELEGPPSLINNNKWEEKQINELTLLCNGLINKYKTIEFLTDHSYISPGRKIDVRGSTGKNIDIFPWNNFTNNFKNIKIY